jgi:hypothetical protein
LQDATLVSARFNQERLLTSLLLLDMSSLLLQTTQLRLSAVSTQAPVRARILHVLSQDHGMGIRLYFSLLVVQMSF